MYSYVRIIIVLDLEAERQAYDLFYEYQAKQHKDSDGRFPIEEVPKEFVELRGFLFPMGSEYGPLNADQARSRDYYERILNGEKDPEEVEEVAEWERRSLAEYEETLSRKKKKRKKTGDERELYIWNFDVTPLVIMFELIKIWMLSLRLAASLRHCGSSLARRPPALLLKPCRNINRYVSI
ncbi:unnamed protein product [Cylicostephanus goldi]|uniref:Uncharacterized protein n=1 Tax=Cylicostephanus goldi TaxID=71465 RepID=A0A3P7MU01_CYLGO|nr:unnamed protein product [Cylicostephanus goldi]